MCSALMRPQWFRDASAAGIYKPEAFANHVNVFRDRTVASIVVEAPTS